MTTPPGLQPERTGLAWQRTALAFMVVTAVTTHLLTDLAGAWVVAELVPGAIAAGTILAVAPRRCRSLDGPDALQRSGTLPALCAGSAILMVAVAGVMLYA